MMARGKILVVDDSPTDLAVMTAPLRRDGYNVVTAGSGEEALVQLEQEAIDLVLLDVIMPGINGFQLCRSLRRDQRFSRLPIVFVTSKNQDVDHYWGLKQGADGYLTKPFSTAQLLTIVQRHM
jgi:twitching motility two-component system response regulator PilH